MKRKLLYLLIGAGIGSALTYFYCEESISERYEEELECMREAYQNALQEALNQDVQQDLENEKSAPEASTSSTEQNTSDVDEDGKNRANSKAEIERNEQMKAAAMEQFRIIQENGYRDVVKETEPIQYNLFSKPPKPKDIHNGVDEDDELSIKVEEISDDDVASAYVITPNEYLSEHMDDYDKTTLMYYADGILVEEATREIIPDIYATVGDDFMRRFGEYEEDVVYVRNDRLKTDFDIVYNDINFVDLDE